MTTNQPHRTIPFTAPELLVWHDRLVKLLSYIKHLFIQSYSAVSALAACNPAVLIQFAQDNNGEDTTDFSVKKQFVAKSAPDEKPNPWLQEATDVSDAWTQEATPDQPHAVWAPKATVSYEVQLNDPCKIEFSGPLDHNHYKPGA